MKRLLCAVAAIAAVGTLAFADDAVAAKPVGTFTAWNEGIVKLYSQQGSDDATTGWGPAWDNVTGIDQEWSFSYTGADYGFNGTMEFGMDNFGNTGTFTTATNTDGTYKFSAPSLVLFGTYYKFNKYVELQIGKLNVSDYRPAGTLIEGGWAKRLTACEFGPLLQITPVDNLSLGAFVDIGSSGFAASDYASHINYGVAYSVPDVFSAKAEYRSIDGIANAGVSVAALKPVTLVASAQATTTSSAAFNDSFAVRASAGGSFVQNLTTNVDVSYKNLNDSQFAAEVQGEYALGKYSVGARVGYDTYTSGKSILWGNSDGIDSTGGLEVYPYAVANFDNGSSVRLGVLYTSGVASNNALIELPLVYIWSF